MSIVTQITSLIESATGTCASAELTIPSHESFGHYSTAVALKMAKKEGKNPHQVAESLARQIRENAPKGFLEKVEVAGPGFINIWLSRDILRKELAYIAKDKRHGRSKLGRGKTVIVEYSQPNIAKKMHVGHLRSTIIGDALANVFEANGYKVIRWNYLGDWGTQFGKLIAAYKMWGEKKTIERDPVAELLKLYVRFHDELKTKPELDAMGALEFKKLEEGDRENRKLWKWFRDESLKEFEGMYKLLGVRFDRWTGESAYEKDLAPLIERLKKEDIAKESEGALVIPLDERGLPPALIQKSDGASLYLTRDIASLTDRLKTYKPERIVYVVANEQTLHFAQLFAVAELLGLSSQKLVHAKFGLMVGPDGKKFSTREGRAVDLRELIEKIVGLACESVEKKNPDLPEGKKAEIARAVGIGALKYNDLKENRNSDVAFDWDRMLDFSGNSAPYLQYTYARIKSLIRKAGKQSRPDLKELKLADELALIKKLIDYPGEIQKSAATLLTNNIAQFLYELAARMSHYYETTPILKDAHESRRAARLLLLASVARTLAHGLGMLGIKSPEEI